MKNADEITPGLRSVGIRTPDDALRALLTHLTKSRASPAETIEQLVTLERRERDTRNLASRTKSATLGTYKALDGFDWNHPRAIDRALYEELLDLQFLERGQNVLFRGQSGVGKTTLAQNLTDAPYASPPSARPSRIFHARNPSPRSRGGCGATPPSTC
ncbi:MAG TPA: ATP-binding protein [Vulgatibacter sp.]|nr:ATP-binding protein [Vulgatibacter sp.]